MRLKGTLKLQILGGLLAAVLLVSLVLSLTSDTESASEKSGQVTVETHQLPSAVATPLDWCVPDGSISWADVDENLNEKVAFVGPVTDVQLDDARATLLIGRPDAGYEETVEVILTEWLLTTAKADPLALFANQTVCVRGVPQRIDGELRVVVNSQNDISVY
jgi:hypothetical protein